MPDDQREDLDNLKGVALTVAAACAQVVADATGSKAARRAVDRIAERGIEIAP